MDAESFASVGLLAAAIWSIRVLVSRARASDDPFLVICAAVTAILVLLSWLFVGVGTHAVM